jgi:hypothetical protein
MSAPVEFSLVTSSHFPSGTGSFTYKGTFHIVVQNLAFHKNVAIHAQIGSAWQDIPATFAQSLPDNREVWSAPASNSETQFVAKYQVNGATFWDNNEGANYPFPQAFDEFEALSGRNYKIVLGSASIGGGNLHVTVGVQDLAFAKVVGMVYTTDGWATVQIAFGSFEREMDSGLEVWGITAPIGSSSAAELAVFYRVLGQEFWDNNFWRNYRVTPTDPQDWAEAP